VVLQPVVQSGTAIYGKNFSGGALNGVQKPLRVQATLSVVQEKCGSITASRTDSNKLGFEGLCGSGHRDSFQPAAFSPQFSSAEARFWRLKPDP
jgi:hypothetical protein